MWIVEALMSEARQTWWISVLTLMLLLVVGAVGYRLMAGGEPAAPFAAAAAPPAPTVDALKQVLLKQEELPAGTTFEQAPIAAAGGLYGKDTNIVVSPVSCMAALQLTIGKDVKAAGWVQAGAKPPTAGSPGGQFSAAAGKVPGGVDLRRLREVVGTCKSGTITWKAAEVTAAISLREVKAPTLEGAETFGYVSTLSFKGLTEEQLAAVLLPPVESCGVEPEPLLVEAGTKSCGSAGLAKPATTGKKVDTTVEQHMLYATTGELYLEACEAQLSDASALLTSMHDRMRAVRTP
jgi:hypothetical protein